MKIHLHTNDVISGMSLTCEIIFVNNSVGRTVLKTFPVTGSLVGPLSL
jgi:hypothetical protein